MEDKSVEEVRQQLGYVEVKKIIEIGEIEVINLDYGKVINSVRYKIIGRDSSGRTSEIESKFILPKSKKENFISFESVTKELVCEWIKSLDENYLPLSSEVNEKLARRIEIIKNPWG